MEIDSLLQERVRRELEAHTENDVLAESYKLKARFMHIRSYPSYNRLLKEMHTLVTQNISGKSILDYGCGRGESSLTYLAGGALVSGIDISPVYILDAENKVKTAGFPSSQYNFRAMDAHVLDFEDGTFDLVVGNGILHHLDAKVALGEIWRVLKPSGRVVFLEPLADNPLMKLFRWMTPRARTKDEAPFSGKDIARLTQANNWSSETIYCGLLEAPTAMVTSVLIPRWSDNLLIRAADRLERWTHSHNLFLSWNQYVLFNLVKRY